MDQKKIFFLIVAFFWTYMLSAQQKDSIAVASATQKFIKSFTDFDWETFRNCFSTDATIFFPDEYGDRKMGETEIGIFWKAIFPEFEDKSKKFDLIIKPENPVIQLYGKSAIVTFHMGLGSNYLSRRTLVFSKLKGTWKIVHLHASNIEQNE